MEDGQFGNFKKMKCRFCDNKLKKEKKFSFGNIPMTPNAIDAGLLLENGKPIEYELAISICENCGLIQQFNSPDPSILYFRFKNEIVGDIWEKHYSEFADFIVKQNSEKIKILEIGGGDLSLAERLLKRDIHKITVIEKNIKSENYSEKINVFKGFLEDYQDDSKFDLIYSSHVLEHIDNIQNHIKKISMLLTNNGKLIFSLPNFEKWVESSSPNTFSQEHPIYPTIENLSKILQSNGFKIEEIHEFMNHSVFINAIYLNNQSRITKKNQNKEEYEKNLKLVTKFFENFRKLGNNLRKSIGNSETYLFGANSGTQLLLKNYLNDLKIIGILDNSNLKNKKQLYGFNYIVNKPEILKNITNAKEKKLVICTGKYVQEIKDQVIKINNQIQILTDKDF